jgi:hypothetical protein
MEPFQQQSKTQSCLWAFLKKVWKMLWKSKWTTQDPGRPKTAQDYRDELLNKCPWKDFW